MRKMTAAVIAVAVLAAVGFILSTTVRAEAPQRPGASFKEDAKTGTITLQDPCEMEDYYSNQANIEAAIYARFKKAFEECNNLFSPTMKLIGQDVPECDYLKKYMEAAVSAQKAAEAAAKRLMLDCFTSRG